MATPPEHPWSNNEKNYLLAEIIKAANPSPDVLFNIIRNYNIAPRWEDMPLPPGRSLNSSRYAFDDLRRSLSMQQMGAPIGPNTPLSAPITLKRPYQFEGPHSAGGIGREIRPKLPLGPQIYAQPSSSEPPPKRKRGRPTKAEAQAKAEAAAVAAQTSTAESSYAPAPSSQPRPTVQTALSIPAPPSATIGPPEEAKPVLPPATRMPSIAAMLTPTTREEPKSASHSSSSSGKRRRARSTKSQPEEGSPGVRQQTGYDSPYARIGIAPEDSPVPKTRHPSQE